MAEKWFVIRSKPGKEIVAACTVAAEGFHVFLPVKLVECSHANRRREVTRPLFPGYLFARFDADAQQFGRINYCRGVASRGLMCDAMERPVAVPDVVILGIRKREDAMKARAGEIRTGYAPGDTFLVRRGEYAHLVATYLGEVAGEVWATITMFSRDFVVPIKFEDVPDSGKQVDKIAG
jgi:transcriptional antiterminator RfaH